MKNSHSERLQPVLKAMEGLPVMVLGDIMLDRFIYGHVDRISPESPVPVLVTDREDEMLGGAGNALANLAGLKLRGYILSLIGHDDDGEKVRRQAEELGFDTKGLITDKTRPTIVKTRYLAGHQQLLRSDYEKNVAPSKQATDAILKNATEIMKSVKAVIISDYGKGLLTKELLQAVISTARAKNIPVIVDPKGHDYSIYKGASAVTPNRKELSEATRGMNTKTDQDVVAAAEKLITECDIDAVVATRSRDGMSVVRKGQEPLHLRGADIEVFDVSGAGDTVIATIAAALAAGADLSDAAALANVAGSIVVTKVGTAPIRVAELHDALNSDAADLQTSMKAYAQPGRQRQAPLLSEQEATEQVRRWRARGLKVGFTNGCFDILHKGHVSYLNEARDRCDRLIVALNTDSSVRILKGPERPVHDEDARATVMGALGSVDMVVLFGAQKKGDDNTAIKILERLQPDIYFKGGDYTEDQIPEAPTVRAYGGVVEVMPVYEGHSTTASIKKMRSQAA